MSTALLEVAGLHCGYGEVAAVSDLSLTVGRGRITALLGANGAGKTSTLMAIMGHLPAWQGRLLFDGTDIAPVPALARVRLGIALVPEGRRLFPDLTVEETLTVGGYAGSRADDRRHRAHVFDLFPRLAERRTQIAGSLSGGEQQMLAIGRAMMAAPTLLLIDELSLGLMPKMIEICLDALTALNREGMSLLLVEQNTARALAVADTVCIMAAGRAVFSGDVAAARREPDLFARYLGIPA